MINIWGWKMWKRSGLRWRNIRILRGEGSVVLRCLLYCFHQLNWHPRVRQVIMDCSRQINLPQDRLVKQTSCPWIPSQEYFMVIRIVWPEIRVKGWRRTGMTCIQVRSVMMILIQRNRRLRSTAAVIVTLKTRCHCRARGWSCQLKSQGFR